MNFFGFEQDTSTRRFQPSSDETSDEIFASFKPREPRFLLHDKLVAPPKRSPRTTTTTTTPTPPKIAKVTAKELIRVKPDVRHRSVHGLREQDLPNRSGVTESPVPTAIPAPIENEIDDGSKSPIIQSPWVQPPVPKVETSLAEVAKVLKGLRQQQRHQKQEEEEKQQQTRNIPSEYQDTRQALHNRQEKEEEASRSENWKYSEEHLPFRKEPPSTENSLVAKHLVKQLPSLPDSKSNPKKRTPDPATYILAPPNQHLLRNVYTSQLKYLQSKQKRPLDRGNPSSTFKYVGLVHDVDDDNSLPRQVLFKAPKAVPDDDETKASESSQNGSVHQASDEEGFSPVAVEYRHHLYRPHVTTARPILSSHQHLLLPYNAQRTLLHQYRHYNPYYNYYTHRYRPASITPSPIVTTPRPFSRLVTPALRSLPLVTPTSRPLPLVTPTPVHAFHSTHTSSSPYARGLPLTRPAYLPYAYHAGQHWVPTPTVTSRPRLRTTPYTTTPSTTTTTTSPTTTEESALDVRGTILDLSNDLNAVDLESLLNDCGPQGCNALRVARQKQIRAARQKQIRAARPKQIRAARQPKRNVYEASESRLKTKPVYDTFGYWVPSTNPVKRWGG